MLHELMSGVPPFFANMSAKHVKRLAKMGAFRLAINPLAHTDPVASDLMGQLLQQDPELRLGVRGAQDVQGHPYFSEIDWIRAARGCLDPPSFMNALDFSKIADPKSIAERFPFSTPIRSDDDDAVLGGSIYESPMEPPVDASMAGFDTVLRPLEDDDEGMSQLGEV